MGYADDWVTTLSGVGANAIGNEIPLDPTLGGATCFHVQRIDSGEVHFEGTLDAEVWSLVRCQDLATGAWVTSTTNSGIYRVESTGLAGVRSPNFGWTTGLVKVRALPMHG